MKRLFFQFASFIFSNSGLYGENHLKKHKIILNIEVGSPDYKPCNLPG